VAGGYETVVGIEVHVHLSTRSKLFCPCPAEFGRPANTRVCPVCLGLPGVLPVLNRRAFELAVRAALSLGCEIAPVTKFDRKNYYYPDLPKNYQVSQYDMPLSSNGTLEFELDGRTRRVRIRRAHLEEDAGKLLHDESGRGLDSRVDLNRSGVPLLEIVTEPDIRSPEEAGAYLAALKQLLEYAGVSSCSMQEGSMRCEPNVSVRPAGSSELGTKTEVKNLNSFRAVVAALEYERDRQVRLVSSGGKVIQETMLWDPEKVETRAMRSKEEAQDYRYFPEPDLPPFTVTPEFVESVRASLGERPAERRRRFREKLGIDEYSAGVLTAERAVADFFEAVLAGGAEVRDAANWVREEVLRACNERRCGIDGLGLEPGRLAGLIQLVKSGAINRNVARESVFPEMLGTGKPAEEIVREKGLTQVSDETSIDEAIRRAIAARPKALEDYRKGKKAAAQAIFGQAMKESGGRANPQVIRERLEKLLEETLRGD